MTREDLKAISEDFIKQTLLEYLPPNTQVFIFGSRARGDARWNSDYDLWINDEISNETLHNIQEKLEESFVPFSVDIVTKKQLENDLFSQQLKKDCKPWM